MELIPCKHCCLLVILVRRIVYILKRVNDIHRHLWTPAWSVGLVLGDVPHGHENVRQSIEPMFLAFTGSQRYRRVGRSRCYVGRRLHDHDDQRYWIVSQCRYHRRAVELVVCSAAYRSPYHHSIYLVQTVRRICKGWQRQRHHVHGYCLAAGIMKLLLFGIPMFFALYFGAEAVGSFMNSLPEWITNALGASPVRSLPGIGLRDDS